MANKLGADFFDTYVTTTFDIAYALSGALDLVNPLINNHHQRVAYIAGSLAQEAGLPHKKVEDIILASLIHDIGVIMEDEFRELAEFTSPKPENELCHAIVGAELVSDMRLLPGLSPIIKYHHTPFNSRTNPLAGNGDENIPDEAGIVHLADRIDILLDRDMPALDQKKRIADNVRAFSGIKFAPEHVEAFNSLSEKESFWFNIEDNEKFKLMKFSFKFSHVQMDMDNLLETARLLSRIIDFRCVFTANHSAGVAAVAEAVGGLLGCDDNEKKALKIAGYMHDIGKLAVAPQILYKDGSLTDSESMALKKHPYFTYSILNNFQIFDKIKNWAAFHHEHMDGSGYPFHIGADKLDTGCRVLAVADVFTALTEGRPYRTGLLESEVSGIMRSMVSEKCLDGGIAELALKNFIEINEIRQNSQQNEMAEFRRFKYIIKNNKICSKNKKFISMMS